MLTKQLLAQVCSPRENAVKLIESLEKVTGHYFEPIFLRLLDNTVTQWPYQVC